MKRSHLFLKESRSALRYVFDLKLVFFCHQVLAHTSNQPAFAMVKSQKYKVTRWEKCIYKKGSIKSMEVNKLQSNNVEQIYSKKTTQRTLILVTISDMW